MDSTDFPQDDHEYHPDQYLEEYFAGYYPCATPPNRWGASVTNEWNASHSGPPWYAGSRQGISNSAFGAENNNSGYELNESNTWNFKDESGPSQYNAYTAGLIQSTTAAAVTGDEDENGWLDNLSFVPFLSEATTAENKPRAAGPPFNMCSDHYIDLSSSSTTSSTNSFGLLNALEGSDGMCNIIANFNGDHQSVHRHGIEVGEDGTAASVNIQLLQHEARGGSSLNCSNKRKALSIAVKKRPNRNYEPCSASTSSSNKSARRSPLKDNRSQFQVERERHAEKLHALHQLVSPIAKTDKATVLSEAIDDIHRLQDQIQMLYRYHQVKAVSDDPRRPPKLASGEETESGTEEEEEEANGNLRGRGFCLVPTSFVTRN